MKLKLTALATCLVFAGCSTKPTSTSASSETAKVEITAATKANTSNQLCTDFGPQTPRDISSLSGSNLVDFVMAPASTQMNLCNIHTHTNAEHKGPGFSVFVNNSDNGGFACNDANDLTSTELFDPYEGKGAYKGVKPGDTIEVHWVHTSCDIEPGEGLGSCLSETCTNPVLRVEAQVFLVVNDPENALDFTTMDYKGKSTNGLHQPGLIPNDTGTPVVFRGSTTGPSYTQSTCSPLNVTWSVRLNCARVDIGSLHRWAEQGNRFNETKSHGVRQLVTAPELLAPIE